MCCEALKPLRPLKFNWNIMSGLLRGQFIVDVHSGRPSRNALAWWRQNRLWDCPLSRQWTTAGDVPIQMSSTFVTHWVTGDEITSVTWSGLNFIHWSRDVQLFVVSEKIVVDTLTLYPPVWQRPQWTKETRPREDSHSILLEAEWIRMFSMWMTLNVFVKQTIPMAID